ncbi:MAG: hypothetical protein GY716_23830 [bacterium]|nr:hypothetical protein [bacterium]
MSEQQSDTPEQKPDAPEEQLPPYVIEGARSSRARCKTCRRKIDKGVLRIGILIEGPYGTGYLWHHLKCAARKQFERVEEAYGAEAWNVAKEPPSKVPPLDSLRELRDKSEERKATRKEIPYAELAPSGRARCKHCDELIEKGSVRIALGRTVEFGNQVRTAPINVHPACVAEAIQAEDCDTESDGFAGTLRAHTLEVPPEQLDRAIAEIGNLE